jgi:hypothetical protein
MKVSNIQPFGDHLTIEASPSRSIEKMLIFPMYEGHRDLAIVQPMEIMRPSYSAAYENHAFPHPSYGAARGNPPK